MDIASIIAVAGIAVSIMVNVTLVGRWSGKTSAQIAAIQCDIQRLEVKQDKSNAVKERLVRCEESTKSAHHRIDEIAEKNKRRRKSDEGIFETAGKPGINPGSLGGDLFRGQELGRL